MIPLYSMTGKEGYAATDNALSAAFLIHNFGRREREMMENKYDEQEFFEKYAQMERSKKGLAGAGEWYAFQRLLPDFTGKRVLDLGCGYGWHCGYAAQMGAAKVVGVDISSRMLQRAREMNSSPLISYHRASIEEWEITESSFDIVISSLALHYVEDYIGVCQRVWKGLTVEGNFVFSVEHPVFTAEGRQDWWYGKSGEKLHWPVDRYFSQGRRDAVFLGEKMIKYHRTVGTYVNTLLNCGFELTELVEPEPEPQMLRENPAMKEELRRPMMLLISAQKRA